MAAPATTMEFLDLVRKSKQVDTVRLDNYVQSLPATLFDQHPRKLAQELVRAGLLTRFQAEQLLLGKYKGFSLGGYRILERLGAGGMAAVYLAEHELMQRRVALKIVLTTGPGQDEILLRFCREARAAALLAHPNIVRVYDFRHEGTTHFLVMEYIEGATLQELLSKKGPLPIALACHYAFQTALALHHVHERGLVHRDVKPSNLLIDQAGTVKLLDLGLARFIADGPEAVGETVVGTADYIAPEQTRDSSTVDARADVYTLGGTLYAMLTGHPPFPNGSVTQKLLWHQMRMPTAVRQIRPEVPEALDRLILQLLAKRPAQRPSSCEEVARLIAPYVLGADAKNIELSSPHAVSL